MSLEARAMTVLQYSSFFLLSRLVDLLVLGAFAALPRSPATA